MTEKNINHLGVGLSWFSESDAPSLDPLLKNWLSNTGSLTERLQANCRQLNVKLLAQGLSAIDENESELLYGQFGHSDEQTEVREVLLVADGLPWVFARSLMPSTFLQESMQSLQNLGEQPLGKIIFNDDRFKRQRFELTTVSVEQLPQKWQITGDMMLWGRRSLFTFEQYHMMVAELFLPGSPAYSRFQSEHNTK